MNIKTHDVPMRKIRRIVNANHCIINSKLHSSRSANPYLTRTKPCNIAAIRKFFLPDPLYVMMVVIP